MRPVPREFAWSDADRLWLAASNLRLGSGVVCVSSADGGVGRSTLIASLGGLLALACPGPVLAIDATGRAWGGLGIRVGGNVPSSVWDAVRDLATLVDRRSIERYVQTGPTRLQALVAEVERTQSRHPPRLAETLALVPAARPHYSALVLDCPVAERTDVLRTAAAAAAPILVARSTVDSLRHTMRLVAYIRAVGLASLADRLLLVVMATTPTPAKDARAVQMQAAANLHGVIGVPFDPGLARAEPADPRRLRRATRDALVQVAAAVVDRLASESPITADTSTSAPSGMSGNHREAF